MGEIKLLQGNEVVAEAALAAGCRFYAGYPITPSSEIAAVIAQELPKIGGKFIQMEDEIASMGAVIGASLAGAKSLTATSGPGFSLKQEHIGFACIAEVPCVIVNVMRGGPSTGLPTAPSQGDIMQSRWGTHGDHPIIVLSPSTLIEIYHMTIRAFNLSEKYRTPVILLLDEVTGHMSGRIEIPKRESLEIIDRTKPNLPPEIYKPYDSSRGDITPMANYFEGYRFHVTGLNHDQTGFPTLNPEVIQRENERLARKINDNLADILRYEEYNIDDNIKALIVAHGSTALSAKEAIISLKANGINVGLFRPITLWPFPEKALLTLLNSIKNLSAIIVPEMNMGQLVLEVERIVKNHAPIYGINIVDSRPIPPDAIIKKIKEVI